MKLLILQSNLYRPDVWVARSDMERASKILTVLQETAGKVLQQLMLCTSQAAPGAEQQTCRRTFLNSFLDVVIGGDSQL